MQHSFEQGLVSLELFSVFGKCTVLSLISRRELGVGLASFLEEAAWTAHWNWKVVMKDELKCGVGLTSSCQI